VLTARARLALLHTATVLVAGVVLTALTYLLTSQDLGRRLALVTLHSPGPGAGPVELTRVDQVRGTTLATLLTAAGIALVVVTALAALTGWAVAGRVLRPVRTMTATARRLSAENLAERVPVPAPADELAALAGTVNGMLDRVQRGLADRDRVLAGQRLFTAHAAHELRTPLTTMRTAVEVTLDGEPDRAELVAMAADVRAAAEQCQRTLDGLLVLAHSQAGPREHRPVDLAATVRRALDAALDRPGVDVRTDLRPAEVDGAPVLLDRMIANLVDNALAYNHRGGHVEISTAGTTLRITNTGPVVEDAPALLEPFVRGAAGPRGTGLGLSIVRAVVDAHHGRLTVLARPTGGLDVTATLPTGRAWKAVP
jgi:signal transduction histidine kinase